MAVRYDEKLLTRDQFREHVFLRDNHKCVFCDSPAVDAHHILERRLFSDTQLGGYYPSNGASVCEKHHLECEMTLISVEDVREACGIEKWTIPDHLYDDHIYDKWGNVILPNGQRMRGELFYDESVQKILAKGQVLDRFVKYVKYQRTYHIPDSPGVHDDDRQLRNMDQYVGKEIVVTIKADGECTTMYSDYIHARSIDGRSHPSRDWVKGFHAQIAHDIPETFRVIGENVYAKHSIAYDNLPSYFLGFQVWDNDTCLSWDDTLMYFQLLGITPVEVVWRGIYDPSVIKQIAASIDCNTTEGFVIRPADSFKYDEFKRSVSKWVRKGHIQTNKHWMYGQAVEKNQLKKDE